MVKQMPFMDPPAHTRLRSLESSASTPRRIEVLRSHIQDIADRLIEIVLDVGQMDRLNLTRTDNRHVAFGWAAHFCFGAALARIEGQISFAITLRRLPRLALQSGPLSWRPNLGLRGLIALPVRF